MRESYCSKRRPAAPASRDKRHARGPRAALRSLLCAALLTGPFLSDASARDEALAEESITLINDIRQRLDACGAEEPLGPPKFRQVVMPEKRRTMLSWNDRLAAVAARHGRAMVAQQFFDHIDPKGRSVGHRATEGGYVWRVVGENLAAGQDSLTDAFEGWLQSASHCRNMIDERFTEFGLARVRSADPDDVYGTYWVIVFGRPQQPDRGHVLTAHRAAEPSPPPTLAAQALGR